MKESRSQSDLGDDSSASGGEWAGFEEKGMPNAAGGAIDIGATAAGVGTGKKKTVKKKKMSRG
ncbi:hypothetical protein LTR86_010722 [Recurvomyces mirabilis]|nr:hypothetical protein LTR86_010722 [Recurvomyces mirabilis]